MDFPFRKTENRNSVFHFLFFPENGKEITIIPNGVDFERFAKKIYSKNNRPTVLFGAADFHWMQNKEGAKILIDLIWPKIKKQVKNARLWVVGKIAPLALKSYLKRKDLTIEEIRDSVRLTKERGFWWRQYEVVEVVGQNFLRRWLRVCQL